MRPDVSQLRKKPLNIIRSKKVYGLKIAQSIIYVKEYFYMFYSVLKDLIQAQNKIKVGESAKTLWLFA